VGEFPTVIGWEQMTISVGVNINERPIAIEDQDQEVVSYLRRT
jgi:hypothetical protein